VKGETQPPEAGEGPPPGLSRARVVSAALGLVQEAGLESLTMRALADRLNVKAASLYWHVRDRRDLLELLAGSILDGVTVTRAAAWRPGILEVAAALGDALRSQRDADRILLEVPEALQASGPYARLLLYLQDAGTLPSEAAELALMAMMHVIGHRATSGELAIVESGGTASIAIDSGSRGVVLRHGADMQTLIRAPHDPSTAAPAIVRGETVKVRRLRGVGRGDIELNPRRAWRFQIQGPTWNTVLDVAGLDVREIKLDSGAAKVECFLPEPRGVVPIVVSGGVVGLTLHRLPGVAVIADISPGALRLKLDSFAVNAATTDLHWESAGAASSSNRYELRINGGAVQVTLDENAKAQPTATVERQPAASGDAASALEILLDGVEQRARSRAGS
jgi:TetR/AcrR family tetracycline transcriptional repressor